MVSESDQTERAPSPSGAHETRQADFYAAAVYGSIVAAALVAPFREEHVPAETIVLSLFATMAIFWLGHVWSAIVGERIHLGEEFTRHRIAEIARAEWPLIEATFAPAIVLALGWAGLVGDRTAATLALVVCVLELFAWGLVLGRRAYEHWWAALLSGVTNGVLGLVLVSLEIVLVH